MILKVVKIDYLNFYKVYINWTAELKYKLP